MGGVAIIFPLKLYEVVNGSERYMWDQDWFVPLISGTATKSATANDAMAARIASGLPDCSLASYFATNSPFTGFRKIDFAPFINKTIRCKVKDEAADMYFEFSVTESTSGNRRTITFSPVRFYRGGTLRLTWSEGSYTNCYYELGVGTLGEYASIKYVVPLPFINAEKTALYRLYMNADHRYDDNWFYYYYYAASTTNPTLLNGFLDWLGNYEPPVVDDENPYWEGGTSEEGGGGGNFSDDSDTVDEDQLPNIDAIGTGFATLFTPTKYQLTQLANVMWDSNVFTALQNLVENISNMFTSLAIVPFVVEAGSTAEVTWLGLPITNIYLTLAAKQYYEFDMGSIDLSNDSRIFTSGSALDYSPFSKLGIFLPFIGFQDLDIDECRDATVGLKYRIDILSGTCVALISVNGNPIYQFTGNCLSQIPITHESMQSLVSDAVQVGIAAAATHSAAGAVGSAEAEWGTATSEADIAKANTHIKAAESHLAATRAGLASATANAAMGMKPTYGKAGAVSASAALLAVKQPYLFLTTPRQCIPDHYQRYCGFPSNISGKLSSFSGFTVVEDIRLNGLVATSPEVTEIYKLLKSGVII